MTEVYAQCKGCLASWTLDLVPVRGKHVNYRPDTMSRLRQQGSSYYHDCSFPHNIVHFYGILPEHTREQKASL